MTRTGLTPPILKYWYGAIGFRWSTNKGCDLGHDRSPDINTCRCDLTVEVDDRTALSLRREVGPTVARGGRGRPSANVEPTAKKPAFASFLMAYKMLVRSRGLEPPRLAALPPQGSASTNSAMTAHMCVCRFRQLACSSKLHRPLQGPDAALRHVRRYRRGHMNNGRETGPISGRTLASVAAAAGSVPMLERPRHLDVGLYPVWGCFTRKRAVALGLFLFVDPIEQDLIVGALHDINFL